MSYDVESDSILASESGTPIFRSMASVIDIDEILEVHRRWWKLVLERDE